jgi:membrane-associated phospholipid phosphatase
VSLLPAALLLAATPSAGAPLPTPFDGIGGHALDAFQGPNLALHATAVASTAALAYGGVDHSFRVAVQHQVSAPAFEAGAVYGGAILPVVVSGGLYLAGVAADNPTLAGAGSAAVQALFLTFTATVVLKLASGRPFPLHGEARDAPDQLEHPERARDFFRSPLDGHLAWPSGHTSAVISVTAALSSYFADSAAVPLIGYPLGLAVGAGMIVADSHWASDVVAGALLGQAIGWTVGSGFRMRQRSRDTGALSGWMVVPLLDGVRGVGVACRF